MKDRFFDRPIFVRQGSRLTREITGVRDALDFLELIPQERRDLVYQTEVGACWSVLDDQKPVAAAEQAIRRFAERCGLLEEQTVPSWITQAEQCGEQLTA